MKAISALSLLSLCGCGLVEPYVDPDNYRMNVDATYWASRNDIIKAAKQCGIANFEPYEAGAAWAAYTNKKIDPDGSKEDCIYENLADQGLLATR